MTAKMKKTPAGRYYTQGQAHAYTAVKAGRVWELQIHELETVAGVQVAAW